MGCANCGVDAFMPFHLEEYYQEKVIDAWFCSPQCIIKYLEPVTK